METVVLYLQLTGILPRTVTSSSFLCKAYHGVLCLGYFYFCQLLQVSVGCEMHGCSSHVLRQLEGPLLHCDLHHFIPEPCRLITSGSFLCYSESFLGMSEDRFGRLQVLSTRIVGSERPTSGIPLRR